MFSSVLTASASNTAPVTPTTPGNTADKRMDDYEVSFIGGSDRDKLFTEVSTMEANSTWIPSVLTKEIRVHPIPSGIHAAEITNKTGMDIDLVSDTAMDGTNLYATLPNGKTECIRTSAKNTLLDRACLNGTALRRECPEDLAATLNMALKVAIGSSLVLERYGKISAFHSDAGGGYRIMPISELLKITEREMNNRFGTPEFMQGYHSHSYTQALWQLPDVQGELSFKYEQALLSSVSTQFDVGNLMPVVRFSSSDTATSSAIVQPMFRMNSQHYLRFCDPISIKHTRSANGEIDGVELFEENVKNMLFTWFEDSIEAATRLSKIEIWHPENVVVGVCNKLRIAKKYGEIAREQVENFMLNANCLSAHDIFLSLSEAIGKAPEKGAKNRLVLDMEEKLYSVVNDNFDWTALDVGGLVAWATPQKNRQ